MPSKSVPFAKDGAVGGGSFQSMGLHPWLLRSLTLQGFRVPTPIQRQSIPVLLSHPPRDLVGMARTGSGKSLAFLIPLVQRLGGRHAATFGARALILLPARELALQVLKVGKELSRGWRHGEGSHAGDKDRADGDKGGQGLRWGLIVGGEGMDEQFEMISNNPDVIIATPGRLLHLIIEMNLDLRSVQYVVFDEADRLFEMGFETALTEIVHRLPPSRQTILFSATLPKSLVEFARAGLQAPKLVRLDSESKISPDLTMAFFSVKQAEKDASLLLLLRDVICVPLGSNDIRTKGEDQHGASHEQKKKRKVHDQYTAPHQTLVFAATKHHVEYLTNLLVTAGYAVSHIYGALDQVARTQQMEQFRRGLTNILVVTDVAARGIDIPVLENVVNYDFPQGARVFVHRIGRTARAGRHGWAWSFVTNVELPHLIDLQLFLGRPIKTLITSTEARNRSLYADSLILGTFARDKTDEEAEYIQSLDEANHSLPSLRQVMRKGQGMYERSKGKASQASYKRAKAMMKEPGTWGLAGAESEGSVHPVFLLKGTGAERSAQEKANEDERKVLLRKVNSFRPQETALEIGMRGKAGNVTLMQERRKALNKAVERAAVMPTSTHDTQFYMSHYQKGAETEKGYSLRDGATFAEQARNATFDLAGDEAIANQKRARLTWDTKKKKFIKGDGAGADNVKMVRTESGTKLPATYRSGRFDEWKAKNRMSLPRVGEVENAGKRSIAGARNKGMPGERGISGRYNGKPLRKVKSELKTVDQIRRDRSTMSNRRAKNARPSRKKGKR